MHTCTADGNYCTCCPCRSAQALQSSLEDVKALLAQEQQKTKNAGEVVIKRLLMAMQQHASHSAK